MKRSLAAVYPLFRVKRLQRWLKTSKKRKYEAAVLSFDENVGFSGQLFKPLTAKDTKFTVARLVGSAFLRFSGFALPWLSCSALIRLMGFAFGLAVLISMAYQLRFFITYRLRAHTALSS